ncbi:S8 family peptidase [Paenibacillus daejeonensis]|uniref:S8 family peptidase n=1 Tax=Paenibacillus daejeonensis TaxID=135193 RepID=UPI0003722FA9|nr:S8 family serine peptidase [Paenibacillus daejeonensis]
MTIHTKDHKKQSHHAARIADVRVSDRRTAKLRLWRRMMLCAFAALLLALTLHLPAGAPGSEAAVRTLADGLAAEEPDSWLVKWHDPLQMSQLRGTELIRRQHEAAVDVVRPKAGVDREKWLQKLRALPEIEYVHPNGKVRTLAMPVTVDPELTKQHYLDQIRVKPVWESGYTRSDLTIAIVDTGIDLQHPDLAGNLVEGINLIKPGSPPQDDNGHGTGVAGVLAAVGNNGQGVSGILHQARIMPIKALDYEGYSEEDRLGEGILHAVRNGAKIVVLSVGLYRYSPYMSDIVALAERQGVLLVGAAGNDGLIYGDKAAVKYPAGYPTVLAVGGATHDNQVEPRSNPGPEMDIVAPWRVYTTKLGGGYKHDEGTSLAAPQAAGVAALLWAKYPELKPYQVRQLLRQSAKDIGPAGWDSATGYGLLQADKAMSIRYNPDPAEPNNSRAQAYPFPLQTQLSGVLDQGSDRDWFVIDAPYDGKLTILFQGLTSPGEPMPPVVISHHDGEAIVDDERVKIGTKTAEFLVQKGKNYIELKLEEGGSEGVLPYLITSEFRMNPDPYEVNDKSYQAYTLVPQSQEITGNFHQTGDYDWFAVTFTQGGKLKLKVSTDTVRIDPRIAIQRAGDPLLEIDEHGDGHDEESPSLTITPGKYYIRINNAAAAEASPVVGTYTLTFDYLTEYDDPNEPNNRVYEATTIRSGTEYVGVIHQADDVDWFQIRVNEDSILKLQVEDIPASRSLTLELFDRTQTPIRSMRSKDQQQSLNMEQKLQAGQYFIKISADAAFNHQFYRFKVEQDELLGGFRDIQEHWAAAAIVSLHDRNIIGGYGDDRFKPANPVTRAEAATMLVRAYRPVGGQASDFKDVQSVHWAYGSIMTAAGQGWVSGYPGGSYRPEQPISRSEMAAMLRGAMGIPAVSSTVAPFSDVEAGHWSAPTLTALKQAGWITGFPGNVFYPGQQASRAEFAALLHRALTP